MNGTTFADHGIDAPAHGTGEYRTTCPNCEATRTNKREKTLSVNLDKGTWNCHRASCGWTGGLSPERPQGTPPQPQERPVGASHIRTRPLSQGTLAWLKSCRGISQATAETAGVLSADTYFASTGQTEEAVAFIYTVDGQHVGTKARATVRKDHTQTKGGCKTAYMHDLAVGCSQIIVTEGELDALSLMEVGLAGAVSCPEGAPPATAKSLDGKLEFLATSEAVFKPAERIILAMDNDEPGIRWRDAIAEALGPERCLTVAWPEGCKDANEVLVKHGREVLLACIRNARLCPCPGLHEAAEYTDALLARHASADTQAGYSTGWRNLDAMVRIELGALHIVTGIPGSGKSELLDGLALNTARLHGWRWAVFSPENYPIERHLAKLVEKHLDAPFKSLSAEEVRVGAAWIQERFVFLTEDDRGLTVDRLAGLLKAASARYGIRGAIVDPWNEVEHHRPQHVTETEYTGAALTLLRNIARREGIALFIAAHPTKMEKGPNGEYGVPTPYDIAGSANWRNKADVCLSVSRPLARPENWCEVHVQKIRHRDVGKLGKAKLYWCPSTGTYGDFMR